MIKKIIFTLLFPSLLLCPFLYMASTSFADDFDDYIKGTGYEKSTPIIRATIKNDIDEVRRILEENKDSVYDRCIVMNAPPLLYAIENNNLDIAKLLIENGAEVNAQYDFEGGPTLLMSARGEMAELLIKHGADVNDYVVEGDHPLGSAIYRGDLETMKILVKHGASTYLSSVMDEGAANGEYALACFIRGVGYKSTEKESIEVLKYLMAMGADIHANIEHLNNPSQSLLMYMAEANALEIMEFLLDEGVDINAKDYEGKTALDYAMLSSNKEATEFLLANGAKVQVNAISLMPLARDNDIERMQFFVDRGADVNAKDGNSNTALYYAVSRGQKEAVEFLLKNGADVNAIFNHDRTVLTAIGYNKNKEIEAANTLEIYDMLIKAGADVNAKDKDGITPLMHTLRMKVFTGFLYDWDSIPCLEAMKLLLDNKADIHAKNTKEQNILLFLLDKTDDMYRSDDVPLEIMHALKEYQVDFQVVDNEGNTALHIALKEPLRQDIIQFLLDNGININARNNENYTPLMTTTSIKRDMVNFLVKNGADVNAQGKHGVSALMWAVTSFNREHVDALLENGADIHLKDRDGDTVLSYTGKSDFVHMESLVKYGADINAKNSSGHSVLFYAQCFNIDNLLKIEGIDLNIRDNEGNTPLMIMRDSMAKEDLIEAGADVNATNNMGKTALDFARARGEENIVEML